MTSSPIDDGNTVMFQNPLSNDEARARSGAAMQHVSYLAARTYTPPPRYYYATIVLLLYNTTMDIYRGVVALLSPCPHTVTLILGRKQCYHTIILLLSSSLSQHAPISFILCERCFCVRSGLHNVLLIYDGLSQNARIILGSFLPLG